MKKKIIVPIDFSMTALNSYIYARSFAEAEQARLEVIYYDDSHHRSDKEELLTELNEFVKLYPHEDKADTAVMTKIPVHTRVTRGNPINGLINRSKSENVEMIIMGTTGKSDVADVIMGKVSSEIAQRAYCPVMLVPKGAKFQKYKNILYSSNFESADEGMLARIVAFNKKYHGALHFIHVNTKGDKDNYEPIENKIFNKLFDGKDPDFAVNIAAIESRTVLKGLLQYSEENNIDLIVMVNRHRGFFESMFGKSITKKLAFKAPVPILSYHL